MSLNNRPFGYHVRYAPLHLAKPSKHEEKYYQQCSSSIGREYYKLCKLYNLESNVLLRSGETTGEKAIQIIIHQHETRKNLK
jgi:hypothetical protein